MGKYYEALQMCKQASDDGFKFQDGIAGLIGGAGGAKLGLVGGAAAGALKGKPILAPIGAGIGALTGGLGLANYAKNVRQDTNSKAGFFDTLMMMTLPTAGGAAGAVGGLAGGALLAAKNPKLGALAPILGGGLGGLGGVLTGTNLAARDWIDND